MLLKDVYEHPEAPEILYALLKERDDTVNINRRALPSWEDHCKYIDSHPYEAWYIIEVADTAVGSCNLTKANEIGVFIFEHCQGNHYGTRAIKLLMEKHGDRKYIANINPKNSKSAHTFEKLGFKPVQHTYELA